MNKIVSVGMLPSHTPTHPHTPLITHEGGHGKRSQEGTTGDHGSFLVACSHGSYLKIHDIALILRGNVKAMGYSDSLFL